jgi:1-acyl-sn-glycerol-3-phosphate acyltransferase
MLRTAWLVVVAVAMSILCGGTVLIIATFSSTSPLIDPVIRFWARTILRAGGIRIVTEGGQRIQAGQRYVLVSNHYSYLDIPCLYAALPQQSIRFMAKVSLFKLPIFGWALGRSGFIPIDRKNRRTAVKSFDLAAERIRKGNTIVVFPEEGRSRSREMRPFQRGGFLLALKSGLPIAPLAIDSTFDHFPVGAKRIKPGTVTIRVGEPIPTKGRSVREKQKLAAEAREQIGSMLFGAGWRSDETATETDAADEAV